MVTGYGGTYRATVVDDADPMQQYRLLVLVPDVHGDALVWAVALMAGSQLPAIGDLVWVSFEHGDSDYPIWEPEAGQTDGHTTGGYAGGYRGTVLLNDDPMQEHRIEVTVPDVDPSGAWAMPSYDTQYLAPPDVGSEVWVEYDSGAYRLPTRAGSGSPDRNQVTGAQQREVAECIAVVPELFLEDGVEALLQGFVPFSSTSTGRVKSVGRHRCEIFAKARGSIGAHGEGFRDRRRQAVIEAGPREVDGADVRQAHRVEASAEDRRGEPLVHREDQMAQRLHEGPLVVDRLVQRVFGERPRPGDRLRPRAFERRPRRAHPSGSDGRSIARSGYHGSRSFTYSVTSTPLMTRCRPARRCRR